MHLCVNTEVGLFRSVLQYTLIAGSAARKYLAGEYPWLVKHDSLCVIRYTFLCPPALGGCRWRVLFIFWHRRVLLWLHDLGLTSQFAFKYTPMCGGVAVAQEVERVGWSPQG